GRPTGLAARAFPSRPDRPAGHLSLDYIAGAHLMPCAAGYSMPSDRLGRSAGRTNTFTNASASDVLSVAICIIFRKRSGGSSTVIVQRAAGYAIPVSQGSA